MQISSEGGFTLVELAFVLVIAGLLLSAAAAIAIPMIKETRMIATQAKLDRIAKAIDFYATQNYRVPCPAEPLLTTSSPPFGFERGSGANGDQVPSNCGGVGSAAPPPSAFGIIPFKTLGIPVDWIRDSWGNYITYSISPAFSLDVRSSTIDSKMKVHSRCRTADWFNAAVTYEPTTQTTGFTPKYIPTNPAKARFCCPYPDDPSIAYSPATDLIVEDANNVNELKWSRKDALVSSMALASVTFPNPMTTGSASIDYPAYNDRPTAVVYVLVSHGENGYGAYNVNTDSRMSTALGTASEKNNFSDLGVFNEIPAIDRSGTERTYDDFVLWRTQDMIFASQGKTCAAP